MWLVLQLPAVRSLALVLLSCKLPLGWFESLLPLELQRKCTPGISLNVEPTLHHFHNL